MEKRENDESPEKTQPIDIPPELVYGTKENGTDGVAQPAHETLPENIRTALTERIERVMYGHVLHDTVSDKTYAFRRVETSGEHMGSYVFEDVTDPSESGVIAYLNADDIKWVPNQDNPVLGDNWELLPIVEAEPHTDNAVFERMKDGHLPSPGEVDALSGRLRDYYKDRTIRAPGDYKLLEFVEVVYRGEGEHPYKLLFREIPPTPKEGEEEQEPATLSATPEEFLEGFTVEE